MPVHPRISLNAISSMKQSFEQDLALWRDLGVDCVGLISPKFHAPGWDAARRAVLDARLRVASLSCYNHEIAETLEFAGDVAGKVLYVVSGGAGAVPWEEAAEKFCREMAPIAARAAELGVKLAVEPTNPLRADVSFVYTTRDAIDLARMAGIGVCIDLYSAWYERGLAELVRKNIDLVALVQICDYKIGTHDTPNRCAIGEGDIPVERLIGTMLSAGYDGAFELEILGPRIEAEGYRVPIARSLERASEILARLGA
jgi:sugar phosphate isomerase/epimerase